VLEHVQGVKSTAGAVLVLHRQIHQELDKDYTRSTQRDREQE